MKTSSITKYRAFPAVDLPDRQWPSRSLTHAPVWASVDLRDGNQALPVPMDVEEKLEFFALLVAIGFKQIEVGFPSAAETEFTFLRRLIDEGRIPDDVTIQVLVQTREHLIRRTFEAIAGAKSAIVHIYNSTSPLQRKVTFSDATRDEIKAIAVEGAKLVKELVPTIPETKVILQYSPESFSDTELDYAAEICDAVVAVWQPTPDEKMIVNLPATVEWATPNVHADQIEWMCNHFRRVGTRDSLIISLHTHNDRGTGVAATELGLLAGADRVEGTLFGNGERTGNLDITTVALNMNSHGISTGLDFSNMVDIRALYSRVTRLDVHDRHPYAGELVFTAFSGSHQDAIKKGLDRRAKELQGVEDPDSLVFGVPYLTIDPADIGRPYEAIIRINSQSGKGGVAYILASEFGLELPKTMHPSVGRTVYGIADAEGKELTPEDIRGIFLEQFTNLTAPLELIEKSVELHQKGQDGVECRCQIRYNGELMDIVGSGNGPVNAFVHALESSGVKAQKGHPFTVTDYRSQSVNIGSGSDAMSCIQIFLKDQNLTVWGAGIHSSINVAALNALVTAFNRIGEELAARS